MTRGNKPKKPTRSELIKNQADAVRCLAEQATGDVAEAALQGALRLEAIARNEKKKLDVGPVLELSPNATDAELMAARTRQAVKRGEEMFLPVWRETTVGLPNIFLRSGLFRASAVGDDPTEGEIIATRRDDRIIKTGEELGDYDRRIFAACINHYRTRPLAQEVDTTYYQLSKALGVAYSENVRNAIRNSLARLGSVYLQIRTKGLDIPMTRFLDVSCDESTRRSDGREVISFRVREWISQLYGREDWTSLNLAALKYSGLVAWLASFYSTHASKYSIDVDDLCKLSGAACSQGEFNRRLKRALVQLQNERVPDVIRVLGYEIKGGKVTVRLVRW